jgi:hypothetical protein
VANDVATLDILFRKDERTMATSRAARSPMKLARTRTRTVITTNGRDFAVASTLFHRDALPGKVGWQMQTWVRISERWQVVAAHVSIIETQEA